jgi:hypothetical protein
MLNRLDNFVDNYPHAYVMFSVAVAWALAITFFRAEQRKYRAWLAEDNPGCFTVVLARLGLAGSWLFPLMAAAMTAGAVVHAAVLETVGQAEALAWWVVRFPFLASWVDFLREVSS